MSCTYSIGQMAKAGNCKVQTVRYYEERGLLPTAARSSGNQRIYTQDHMNRLSFIRHSRELGFSLDQIQEILELNDKPTHSCTAAHDIAHNHLDDVKYKIKRLQSMKRELERMINECSGGQVSQCRIIEVLSNHQLCMARSHS